MTDQLTTTEAALVPQDKPDKPLPALKPAVTSQEARVVEVSDALAPAYGRASTLELTDAEVAAIMAPFPDSAVDIRPHDGLIYLSHIHISDRLNAVFRPGKWALVCRRHWLDGATMYGEYVLLIRGCFIGESVGGHQYVASNPKVNYSDVLESTAAEALRRICGKRLSCGSQAWHKDYAEKWVAEHAEQVGGKWRKRAIAAPAPAPKPAPTPPRPAPTPKPVAPATAEPLTTAQRREKLLGALRGYEPEANAVFRENALVLETEQWTEISDFTLDRIQPANLLALIKETKQRKADNDQVPDAAVDEPPPDEPAGILGTVEEVNVKTGKTKAGKPWTKYGVKIDGVWCNSFSDTLYKTATGLKGEQCRYVANQTQFGHDLVSIEAVGEVTP